MEHTLRCDVCGINCNCRGIVKMIYGKVSICEIMGFVRIF